MARTKEQIDSFAKAVADVVAIKRDMARQAKIERDAVIKVRRELRAAFRSTVREFDSLEKGLRLLQPSLGDNYFLPFSIQQADVPIELKNALLAVTRAAMNPDLCIYAQAKITGNHIRSLTLSFSLSDVEKASLSLDINKASESLDLRFVVSPVVLSESQKEVDAFHNWIDRNEHGHKAYERRVVAGRSLIRFVTSQAESRAQTYIKAHTSA